MLVTFLIIYRHDILRTELFTQLGINVNHPSRGEKKECVLINQQVGTHMIFSYKNR